MDSKSIISLLNFSKTLIQDGELKFMFYERFPLSSNEVGEEQRQILAFREQELQDASKKPDADMLRKEILKAIEEEKKYGGFRDSENNFRFIEFNLVFRVTPYSTNHEEEQLDVWLTAFSRLEKYPSLGSKRFFNDGSFYVRVENTDQVLTQILPNQFANHPRRGSVNKRKRDKNDMLIKSSTGIPPTHFIHETLAEVEKSILSGKDIYVITHFPFEDDDNVMAKVYVHIHEGEPKVFREEYYYRSESSQANSEGYWLRASTDYSDFEKVDTLNLSFPKIREQREFRRVDGFMRRHTVYTIKEINFNLGVPANFFDWDEVDLSGDSGGHKIIRGDTQQDVTK